VPAVCKMLGRTFLASEIDPATAERARERLANTQPPLPGLVVEQAGLDLSAA
jgi:DNA modification methylase